MIINNQTLQAWRNNEPISTRVIIDGAEISLSNIYEQSLEIEESICDDEALYYVGCIPCSCKIKIRNVNYSIKGKSLEVYTKAGNTEEIPLFKGIVDSVTQDSNKDWFKIEAFDYLYTINNANVSSWYTSLEFPLTLRQFRDSFFNHFGVTQKIEAWYGNDLRNDNVLIEETIGGEEILGADIIKAICQLNAVFGIMNREGVFCYRQKGITFGTASLQYYYREERTMSLEYAQDFTNPVDKLQIRSTSDDIGAIIGDGDNCYIIEGNILAYGKSSVELTEIGENIFNDFLTYRPCKFKGLALPYIECGDDVTFNIYNKSAVSTRMLSRKITGFASFTEEIVSRGVKNYEEAMESTNDSLIQLRGQSNRLTRTVEGLTSEVSTIKGDYASKSMLSQTSDRIVAQIDFLQKEIDGDLTMYYVKEPPTLLNYPAWDFTYNIPCNNTVQTTDDLKFIYNDEYYQKNIRNIAYDETTYLSYRFVNIDGAWGWQQIADTEMGVVMQKITTLEMTTDEIKASVSTIKTSYATKEELNSSISLTSEQILSSVSRKYTTQETTETIRSQINQQADQISAKVSKSGGSSSSFGWNLTDTYFSLVSGNTERFRCDRNGVMVNGAINSTSGNIGGWRITSASIDNGIAYTGEKNNNSTGIGGYGGGWAFWAGNGKFSVKQDGSLYAEKATINGYATAQSVEAVNAKFNNLNADNIKTGTLSANRIDINGLLVNFQGKALNCGGISASNAFFSNLYVFDGGTQRSFYANSTTIAGVRINYWGW